MRKKLWILSYFIEAFITIAIFMALNSYSVNQKENIIKRESNLERAIYEKCEFNMDLYVEASVRHQQKLREHFTTSNKEMELIGVDYLEKGCDVGNLMITNLILNEFFKDNK